MNPEKPNNELCPCVSFLKNLKRSQEDKWIAGVCGGLAKSTEIPAWIFRVFFIFSTFFSGLGIVLYILLWIFMPLED